jgi:hypothetical protein
LRGKREHILRQQQSSQNKDFLHTKNKKSFNKCRDDERGIVAALLSAHTRRMAWHCDNDWD